MTRRPTAPSSTSLRMVLVAVALVVSGLFVGTALYNAIDDSWTARIVGCVAADPVDVGAQLACQAPAERERVLAASGAAVALVLLATVVVLVMPAVLSRRRKLVAADPRYAQALQAVAAMAAAEGVPTPRVLVGPPAKVVAPFCLGRPGDYRIALPRKLALGGGAPLFQALVRHELAHIAQNDVALSWLARSLWYVLAVLLALPVVVTAAYDGDPVFALEILWRSAVLLLVVFLVVRALLRAREFDADLRAARAPGVHDVLDGALAGQPAEPGGWRAWCRWHPSAARRRAVLADPAASVALTWMDGLTVGFLAALTLPIVTGIASAALLGLGVAGLSALVGTLAVGPLAGATLGIGLWRQALVTPRAHRGATAPVAMGVLLGAALGGLGSLAGVDVAPDPPVAVPLALGGAAVLTGGFAELVVRGSRATGYLLPAGAGAVATTALLWAAQNAELLTAAGGWLLLSAWMTTAGTLLVPLIATGMLAAAAVAVRPPRGALLVGFGAGLGGGVGLVGYRLAVGPTSDTTEQLERFFAVVLGAGLVGALAVALLGLTRGVAGIGAGLLAGPVATITAGASYLTLNTALGGGALPLAWPLLGAALPIGVLLAAPAALVGLLPVPQVRSAGLVVALAAVVCALVAIGVMAQRGVLVTAEATPVPPGPVSGQGLPVPRDLYTTVVARDLLGRRVEEAAALSRFEADRPAGAAAAAQIRTQVLPVAEGLVHATTSYAFDDPAVLAVHQHALTAAAAHVEGLTLLAEGFDRGDRALFQRGNQRLSAGNAEWAAWAAAAQAL